MKKIERLTPAQEAELPAFRAQYLDIATGGHRTDRSALQAALNDAYAVIGKAPPRLFVFDSPAACLIALKIFKTPERDQLRVQLWDQLRVQLWVQLWDQLRVQLGGQLRDQLGDQLRVQLGGQLRDQLGGQLGGQLRDQLGVQLRDQLGDQLRVQLWDQIRDQLGVQLGVQLRDQLRVQLGVQPIYDAGYLWGSQDLFWIAWARFAERIGVTLQPETAEKLSIMERIAHQCEWWWPYEGMVIASQRPTAVRWDDQRRLHCESGPAVEYADGYALFAWHGHRLPAEWVLQRETIDPAIILAERNAETKAAGLACIGTKRAIAALGGRVIDADPDPSHGELIEVTIPDLPNPGRFLKAACPRNGEIFEGVPNNINTVLEAQAWRVGLTPAEFSYPPVRT